MKIEEEAELRQTYHKELGQLLSQASLLWKASCGASSGLSCAYCWFQCKMFQKCKQNYIK